METGNASDKCFGEEGEELVWSKEGHCGWPDAKIGYKHLTESDTDSSDESSSPSDDETLVWSKEGHCGWPDAKMRCLETKQFVRTPCNY